MHGSGVGKLVEGLNEIGVKAEEINCIIITHPHPDHIGGIKDFPNAVVYFNRLGY